MRLVSELLLESKENEEGPCARGCPAGGSFVAVGSLKKELSAELVSLPAVHC